jgi:hypothetical protein
MGLPALSFPEEQRGSQRKRVLMTGVLCDTQGAQVQDCTIRDLSETGARIGFARMTRPLEQFFLINVRERMAYAGQLVWHNGLEAGITFDVRIALNAVQDPRLAFLKRLWMERATR